MADLQLVDVSLRDGNQSLWSATGIDTGRILQIAPVMDRVGFRALDFTSSTHMGVAVRVHKEDPWERIRLTRAAMPNTSLQLIGTGFRFISWQRSHPDFMQLVYDRLVANGVTRFIVLDPQHDMEAVNATARQIRKAGGTETVGALTYTITDVHTDAFYAGLAAQMAKNPDIDRVYIKDPSGLLTPERTRTLAPAVKKALGDKPLEMHAHCTIGLAPLCYMAAPELGVETLHVACGALANGSSLPNAQRIVANLRELGHSVDIDDRALAIVADYFTDMARAEGLPVGMPQEFDASFLRHQVAGGTMSTTRRQLKEIGLEDRFDAVMDEVSLVRAELGYPIMVTPFPQIVCTQALYNVIGTERYANVTDQLIRYVLGSFGKPTAPVDPNVMQRILDRPRAKEIEAEPPPEAPSELRKRFKRGISDEEFLLRAVMPGDQVDAMIAAGPARRTYNPSTRPILKLIGEAAARPAARELVVEKPGFRLALRGGNGRNAHA